MKKIARLENHGLRAIKALRKNKLEKGHPFMINSNILPSDQFYYEYPDGNIRLMMYCKNKMDFELVQELDSNKSELIRKRHKLL